VLLPSIPASILSSMEVRIRTRRPQRSQRDGMANDECGMTILLRAGCGGQDDE
jgi:hypothetical protein